MKASVVKFNSNALRKDMTERLIQEQTKRLIEYAKEKIIVLGNRISAYHGSHHMDRTGHLLNSLCWGVAYSGELKASGFYRDVMLHNKGVLGTSESFLHEFYPHDFMYGYPVDGRERAQRYIEAYGKVSSTGHWRVFFAILAPYWGYWEQGFVQTLGLSSKNAGKYQRKGASSIDSVYGSKFQRFAVMSELYDEVKEELKPAKVKLKVHVEKYVKPYNIGRYKVRGTLGKRYDNMSNNPYR